MIGYYSLTELGYLNMSSCKEVTNSGLTEITDKCKKLKLLDVTGCATVTKRNAVKLSYSYLCVIFSGLRIRKCNVLNMIVQTVDEYCRGAMFWVATAKKKLY